MFISHEIQHATEVEVDVVEVDDKGLGNYPGEMGMDEKKTKEVVLDAVQKLLESEGYDVAKLYIEKAEGPKKNDLQRIIAACQDCNISPDIAAEILRSLNEPGESKD